MDINEIARLMQIYQYNSIDSSDSGTSQLFEMILQSLIESSGQESGIGYTVSSEIGSKTQGEPADIMDAVSACSKKYGVDANLIKSVIKQESGFNPNAVSSAGAQGLMQLMPGTSDSLGVDNPLDVLDNIDGGTRYLKTLLNNFGGDKELALAAYNGGIGRMNRLGVDTDEEIDKMPLETQNYVARVMQNYEKYNAGNGLAK